MYKLMNWFGVIAIGMNILYQGVIVAGWKPGVIIPVINILYYGVLAGGKVATGIQLMCLTYAILLLLGLVASKKPPRASPS